jgi:hypothetical protein
MAASHSGESRRLAERMAAITAGRDERFQGWLFPVT